MEQIAGLAWVTGLPEAPPVTPRGACDPLAGVHAAFAVLAALSFAERTGTGQLVELPMLETVLNATAIQAIESEVFGKTLSRQGNRGRCDVIQNVYRCAGEDDWIALTVHDDTSGARWSICWADRAGATKRWPASPGGGGAPTISIAGWRSGSRSSSATGRWSVWPPRAFRRRRGVAVAGHREPPTARSRILRKLGPREHREQPVSVPPFAALAGQDRWLCGRRRDWESK